MTKLLVLLLVSFQVCAAEVGVLGDTDFQGNSFSTEIRIGTRSWPVLINYDAEEIRFYRELPGRISPQLESTFSDPALREWEWKSPIYRFKEVFVINGEVFAFVQNHMNPDEPENLMHIRLKLLPETFLTDMGVTAGFAVAGTFATTVGAVGGLYHPMDSIFLAAGIPTALVAAKVYLENFRNIRRAWRDSPNLKTFSILTQNANIADTKRDPNTHRVLDVTLRYMDGTRMRIKRLTDLVNEGGCNLSLRGQSNPFQDPTLHE